jgi:predicted GIY-YIG superfamily endonuclease
MENRVASHAKGTDAKYTRGRDLYKVIHTEQHRACGSHRRLDMAREAPQGTRSSAKTDGGA